LLRTGAIVVLRPGSFSSIIEVFHASTMVKISAVRAPAGGRFTDRGAELAAPTAVSGEVGQQRIHRAVFGRINQLPAQTALRD
jgi:hypothetical protein